MPMIEILYPVTKDMNMKERFRLKRLKFSEIKLPHLKKNYCANAGQCFMNSGMEH